MSTVSIIVPVYKVKDYITDCVESLVQQDYTKLEILLIDDGSPDDCGSLCDLYAKRYPNVKAFHKANGGLSSARNFGVSKASGEYILFVDSDDYLNSKKAISTCMKKIRDNKADCLVFTYQLVSENKSILPDDAEAPTFPDNICADNEKALEYLLEDRFQNFAWRFVFKKTIWEEKNLHFPEGALFEDISTVYKILANSKKVYFLNSKLYCYRQREGSIMHTPTIRSVKDLLTSFVKRSDAIADKFPNLIPLCEAQKYKAYYRTVMFTIVTHTNNKEIIEFRNRCITYLKMTTPNKQTLSTFNLVQKISLFFIRTGHSMTAANFIKAGKRLQFLIGKIEIKLKKIVNIIHFSH